MSATADAVPTPARKSVPIFSVHDATNWLYSVLDVRHAGGAVVGHRLAAVRVEFGVGAAAQFRRRVSDAAGVDAHQVEVLRDLGVGQARAHAGDGVDRRGAGPAGVDHEYADLVARGRHPDDGQLRLCTFGFRIVEGHRDGAALRGRDRGGVVRRSARSYPRPAAVRRPEWTAPRASRRRSGTCRRTPPATQAPAAPPATWQTSLHVSRADPWPAYPWNTTVTWL